MVTFMTHFSIIKLRNIKLKNNSVSGSVITNLVYKLRELNTGSVALKVIFPTAQEKKKTIQKKILT